MGRSAAAGGSGPSPEACSTGSGRIFALVLKFGLVAFLGGRVLEIVGGRATYSISPYLECLLPTTGNRAATYSLRSPHPLIVRIYFTLWVSSGYDDAKSAHTFCDTFAIGIHNLPIVNFRGAFIRRNAAIIVSIGLSGAIDRLAHRRIFNFVDSGTNVFFESIPQ